MRHSFFVVLSGVTVGIAVLALLVTGIHGIISSIQNQAWFFVLSPEFLLANIRTANIQIISSFVATGVAMLPAIMLWRRMQKHVSAGIYFLYLFFISTIFELLPQWFWWSLDREIVYSSIVLFTRIYVFGSFLSILFFLLLGMDTVQSKARTYRSLSLVVAITIGLLATLIPVDITQIAYDIMESISKQVLLRLMYMVLFVFCIMAIVLNWRRREKGLNYLLVLLILCKGGLHLLLGSELRVIASGVFVLVMVAVAVYIYFNVSRMYAQGSTDS